MEHYRRLKPSDVEVGDIYITKGNFGELIRPYRIISVNDEGFVCIDPDKAYNNREVEVLYKEVYVDGKGILVKQKEGGLEILANKIFLDDLKTKSEKSS